MEIAFVQADDDDDDDVRLRKENRIHKRRAVLYKHEHICVLMLLWTLFGRFAKLFTSLIRNKRSGCFNAAAFSMEHQFVVRLSFHVHMHSVHGTHNEEMKWRKPDKTKRKRYKQTEGFGMESFAAFRLDFRSVNVFFCSLSCPLDYSQSLPFFHQRESILHVFFSLFSSFLLLFRFICTICSALLFAVVGFIFQLLSSLEFCWTFSKTKQHKHTPPRMNFFIFFALLRESRKLCKSIWMEREFKRRPNEQTFLWGYVERVTLR